MGRTWHWLLGGLAVLGIWALLRGGAPGRAGDSPALDVPTPFGHENRGSQPLAQAGPAPAREAASAPGAARRVQAVGDAEVAPAPALVGFARDLAGRRVPGLTLILSRGKIELGRAVTGPLGEFDMDSAEGRFTCSEPHWKVIGYRELHGDERSDDTPAQRVVEVCLARSISFSGRLLDGRGDPLPWQPACILDPLDPGGPFEDRAAPKSVFKNWIGDRAIRIWLSNQGRFEVQKAAVWEGRMMRFVHAEHGVLAVDMPQVDGAELELTFPGVPEERLLHVRVMAASGVPTEDGGVHHRFRWHWVDGTGAVRLKIRSDEQAMLLRATRPGYLDVPFEAPHLLALSQGTPSTLEVFVDEPAPTLQGVVLDPGGAPVPGAYVVIDQETDGNRTLELPGPSAYSAHRKRPGRVYVTADAEGRFAVPCPFLGAAVGWAARGAGREFGPKAQISIQASVDGLTLRVPELAPARKVHGRVQDPSGGPLAGITVSPTIEMEGLETTMNRRLSSQIVDDRPVGECTMTDTRGSFSLRLNEGFAQPRWRLVTPAAEYVIRADSGAGTEEDPLILVLRGPRRVSLAADASQAGGKLSFLDACGERVPFNVDFAMPPLFGKYSLRIIEGAPFEADVPWHATEARLSRPGVPELRVPLRGRPGQREDLRF